MSHSDLAHQMPVRRTFRNRYLVPAHQISTSYLDYFQRDGEGPETKIGAAHPILRVLTESAESIHAILHFGEKIVKRCRGHS